MNIIQYVLLAVVTFIAAIDQFSFLESIYQPIVVGPIVGAILGDFKTGIIVGGTIQLMSIGAMPIGGAQPPNVVIWGIMATVFSITANLTPELAAAATIPFALLGQVFVTLIFTITSPVMNAADRMAAKADTKGIDRLNYATMATLGAAFAFVVVLGAAAGTSFGKEISTFFDKYAWVKSTFETWGGMLRFVGFAVLLRIMVSGELWVYYFAGFAGATILGGIGGPVGGSALILLTFIGLAIAVFDFQTNTRNGGGKTVEVEEDGI